MANEPTKTWLIAAWPGMGNVAIIGAGYLVQALGMEEVDQLPARGHFDIGEVEVKDGVVVAPALPRGRFFRRREGGPGSNLIVFIGEAQPATDSWGYAHELLTRAKDMGAERIVTFASMASGLHPSEDPTVMGVATSAAVLREMQLVEVRPLKEGQIGGLNGVLLGAAAARGMEGMCLLGEIPFFAAAVPNPKAARAVLSVFSVMAGIDVSLEALNQYAEAMDRAILEAMKKIEQQRGEGEEDEDEPNGADEPDLTSEGAPGREAGGEPSSKPQQPRMDYATRNRIEQLFQEARHDRSKAVRLKEELDRLGVFRQYEDRFLDLFRRAE
jgi:proteasome assembly chaperone (PAC2) family protein